jgi:CspA family cold shock protein
MTGTVISWNDVRGFGFIKNDNGGPDDFIHHTEILMEGHRALNKGDRVEYEVEQNGPKGRPVAVRVVITGKAEV